MRAGSLIASTAVAALMMGGLALSAGSALAQSPSQQECEAQGGTFTRERGTVTCTTETNVGRSENSQTVTTTEESKGTLQNDPQFSESCAGPGNSGDSSAHCN
jgi:hypothetical protein